MSNDKKDDGGPDGGIAVGVRGGAAIVSGEDLAFIVSLDWRIGAQGYVHLAGGRRPDGATLMHRIILGAKRGEEIHHINGIKTDNRRSNLEVTTASAHQRHHSHLVAARNRASRKHTIDAVCRYCEKRFTKDPDHRGRQTCCSKDCAIRWAVKSRMAKRLEARR